MTNDEKKQEILALMTLVKGCWQEQASDKVTQAVWYELLSPLSYTSCRQVVIEMARSGAPRPTPGQIYQAASALEAREAERERYTRKALPEPGVSPEQRAKNLAKLRAITNHLAKKFSMPEEDEDGGQSSRSTAAKVG